jgi:hypothetical protein
VLGTHDWRGGWGNEALAGQSGTEPFADVPVIPTGIERLTPAWVIRWAEWVAAGRPEIPESEALAEWNPSLHPRNPENGKFVERSFDVPDDMPDFESRGVKGTLQYLQENDADVEAILEPESGVTIDGVPNDATSVDDIPEGGSGGVVSKIQSAENDEQARQALGDYITENTTVEDFELVNLNQQQSERLANTLQDYVEGDFEADPFGKVDTFKDTQIGMGVAPAAYDLSDHSLGFKPRSMEGKNPRVEEGELVENSPEATIHHEMGHAIQSAKLGDEIFESTFWPPDVTDEDIEAIESEISEYGASAPEEFVAEAYVKLVQDGELSPRIREIYDELGGPTPPEVVQ